MEKGVFEEMGLKPLRGWRLIKQWFEFKLARWFGLPFTSEDKTRDFTTTLSGYKWRGCLYVTKMNQQIHVVAPSDTVYVSIGNAD